MRSVGRRTRHFSEMSGGRAGAPSRRGRSEDQPVRSSAPILTLRVEGFSAMSPSSHAAASGNVGARGRTNVARVAAVPERSRETPSGVGPRLLVAGIALLAINLRPAVVAVAPLTSRIRAGTGLSTAGVSLLTTLPLLCFGVFALLAPRLGRRLGLERALGVAV